MIVRRSALVSRPASHVFDVIEAAEHYPRFLPWCTGATIVSRDASMVSADLQVRWGGMNFEMRTRNPKQRPSSMSIHLERGPFRRFEGEWRLTELAADACKVAFLLEVEFDSRLMTNAAGPVFNRLSNTLLDAFVERALATPVIAEPAAPAPEAAVAPIAGSPAANPVAANPDDLRQPPIDRAAAPTSGETAEPGPYGDERQT
jgi:ribosome-associated toxin RatA of RatAB toxin-antitoxin module